MRILNIGSGPVTPGKTPGIEITNADRRDHPGAAIADMEQLDYPDNSFDLVVCINALDHTPDAEAALREMMRVAKWVYIDCSLIQHTTSGKNHYWDMFEDGTMLNEKLEKFNLKDYGFEIEFVDNGGERRYNHVICRYTK